MIGLDTNLVVRYLAQDDRAQSALATATIEALTRDTPGFISLIVLAETIWVMESLYETSRETVAGIVEAFLETDSLVVESAANVRRALTTFRAGSADFADGLIAQIASGAGCSETLTFDKRAARDAGMRLLIPNRSSRRPAI